MRTFLIAFFSALALLSTGVSADSPTRLGRFGAWEVFKATEDGHPICYMTATPSHSQGKYTKRGDVFIMITHRPYLKSYFSVSIDAGYPIHRSHKMKLIINSKTHTFDLIQGDTAWFSQATTDKDVATAVAKSKGDIIAKGTSKRGTATTDTFSSNGTLSALRRMSRACNVKSP